MIRCYVTPSTVVKKRETTKKKKLVLITPVPPCVRLSVLGKAGWLADQVPTEFPGTARYTCSTGYTRIDEIIN